MTPADRALAARIRAAMPRAPYRVAVSGLDGVGKSTLCAALAEALGLPVIRVPDRERVAAWRASGCSAGAAQLLALQGQLIEAPAAAILEVVGHPHNVEGRVLDVRLGARQRQALRAAGRAWRPGPAAGGVVPHVSRLGVRLEVEVGDHRGHAQAGDQLRAEAHVLQARRWRRGDHAGTR